MQSTAAYAVSRQAPTHGVNAGPSYTAASPSPAAEPVIGPVGSLTRQATSRSPVSQDAGDGV